MSLSRRIRRLFGWSEVATGAAVQHFLHGTDVAAPQMSPPHTADLHSAERSSPDQPAYLDFRDESPAAAPASPPTTGQGPRRETPVIPGDARDLDRGDETGVGAPPPSGNRGIARSVELRYDEGWKEDVLTFHLTRFDASGNQLAPIGVEMRNPRRGHLTEGDEVDVTGSTKYGTLMAERIVNITTGSEMRRAAPQGVKIALSVLLFVVVAIVLFLSISLSYERQLAKMLSP
jgi:hypothetical protein